MKKLLALIMMILIVLAALPAVADELSTALSLQGWFGSYDQTVGDSELSDSSVMFGPVALIDNGRYYASVTYMTTTSDYRFKLDNGEEFAGSKTDLELELGYHLGEMADLHAGWKHDVLLLEYSGGQSLSGDITTRGPTFGVTGYVPVGESGVTLIGDFTVMYLESEITLVGQDSYKESHNGFAMQLGVDYRLTQRIFLTSGYIHQIYVADDGDDTVESGVYFTFGFSI